MGNPRGFIEIKRKEAGNRPVKERITDYGEVEQTLNTEDRILQASRCMDCGVPFCHWGCPLSSRIPEWQDSVYLNDWKEASDILHLTNDFPEFTGRICPAPCEKSCVLAIQNEAVTIRENEAAVVEKAFEFGYIVPKPPLERTGKKVAVIGSGPAGLTVATRLNRMGHTVSLFEKNEKVGGLLRFGIPDFKLNKNIIDRRIKVFEEEGLDIRPNTMAGVDINGEELLERFDAICLAVGSMQPRDLQIKGRNLNGIHFAMDYLVQQNRIIAGKQIPENEKITARNKEVIVIGGGDTGSDCVGTANRQGAIKVTQIEILPKPPDVRDRDNPWPFWPNTLTNTTSHEEGCDRYWSLATRKFLGLNGNVNRIEVIELDWKKGNTGQWKMVEKPGTNRNFNANLVLLALGFTQPVHNGLLEQLNLSYDSSGNVRVDSTFKTNRSKIFAVGDAISGASLVVKAIASGQKAVNFIHQFLLTG
jgi:glutamate synthase (NADPH/NADH) small chain